MTQDEIRKKLTRLRYEGGWSLRGLQKQTGLAIATIKAAMTAQVSESKQARLSNVLPLIPRYAPKPVTKGKPGHLKRYLIRYYNLKGWLEVIEQEPGIAKRFSRKKEYSMSRDRAAFVCARYDYQMKYHLLTLFGDFLKQRKIAMGDCFQCEKWIERIHKALPGARPMLFKKIMVRKVERQPR